MPMHQIWKSSKVVLLLILVTTILLNSLSYANANQSPQPISQGQIQSIIAPDLLQAIEGADENELFSIIVWMDLIPEEDINECLLNETGLDSEIYENQQLFNETVLPEIEQSICQKLNLKEAPLPDDTCFRKYKQELDAAITKEYNNYWKEKHIITRREYTFLTDSFISNAVHNPEREILYQGHYTSTICLKATSDEIFAYASYPYVKEVTQYVEHEMVSCLDVSANQIGVYSSGGTGIEDYVGDIVYDGLGVTVGIIEFSGRYDENSPHLSQLNNLHYIQNDYLTPNVDIHATMVTSIIVGKGVTLNNRTYKGIVPNATVYQTYAENQWGTCNAFVLLVDYGVSVINHSAGDYVDPYYDYFDNEIDRLVATTGVAFVNAAGNTGADVISPGKGYNVITVGNAITKTSTGNSLSTPYDINSLSSYVTDLLLPNKPDICAPGTHIEIRLPNGGYADAGTSYSAPMVTGVIAQMIQANPALNYNPTAIKAILLASANQTKVTANNNPYVYYNMREKSGAGFLDAAKAVENALNYNYFSGEYDSYQSYIGQISCQSGDILRVVMDFDKKHTDYIASYQLPEEYNVNDYDIYLFNSHGGLCAVSCSSNNNVEIIELPVFEDDTFTVMLQIENLVHADDPNLVPTVSVAYSITESPSN